jgi:hypothetical protein
MPATIPTGNAASGTGVIPSAHLAPDHEQGGIVAGGLVTDERSHYVRVTVAMTVAATDVAEALAHAWQAVNAASALADSILPDPGRR